MQVSRGKGKREQPQSSIFQEHNRLFEAYLTPQNGAELEAKTPKSSICRSRIAS